MKISETLREIEKQYKDVKDGAFINYEAYALNWAIAVALYMEADQKKWIDAITYLDGANALVTEQEASK